MNPRTLALAVLLPITAGMAACDKAEQVQAQLPAVTYAADVEPIIQKHCAECHVAGQPGAEASGLLLESYESVMKGSRFGSVIEPGSAMTSSLYVLISGKSRLTVTMPHGRGGLSDEEIETIRVWIENGAIKG